MPPPVAVVEVVLVIVVLVVVVVALVIVVLVVVVLIAEVVVVVVVSVVVAVPHIKRQLGAKMKPKHDVRPKCEKTAYVGPNIKTYLTSAWSQD